MKRIKFIMLCGLFMFLTSCAKYNISIDDVCITQVDLTIPGVTVNGGMVDIQSPLNYDTEIDISDILSNISDKDSLEGDIKINALQLTAQSGISNLNFLRTLKATLSSTAKPELPLITLANYTSAGNVGASIDLIQNAQGSNVLGYLSAGKVKLTFGFTGSLPSMEWKATAKICLSIHVSGTKSVL